MQRALAQQCKRPEKTGSGSPLAGLFACLALACATLPQPGPAQTPPQIATARYVGPTDAYGHGAVAGGEYDGLEITWTTGQRHVLRPSEGIFEDTQPGWPI